MVLDFFMAMEPPTATHQERKWTVRNGKPVSYEPPAVKAARSKLTAHLGQHRPPKPMEGPVALAVSWGFPLKWKHYPGEPMTAKPDTDNLQKLLKDCMTQLGFWKDDAQVFAERVEKFWTDRPGIGVWVSDETNKPTE